MSDFEYPPKIGWCTRHSSPTVCKDCRIEQLEQELEQALKLIKEDMETAQQEQAKSEAMSRTWAKGSTSCNYCSDIDDAIATMEYKEPT